MNCKPGDMAIVVRSERRQHGKIVECISLFVHPLWPGEPCWRVRPALELGAWCHDFQLRPIRDSDGEDEILRIAGLPNKQPEVA